MIQVNDIDISSIGYNMSFGILVIEYKSGIRCEYKKVPYEIYQNLIKSNEKGIFIKSYIAGKFDIK